MATKVDQPWCSHSPNRVRTNLLVPECLRDVCTFVLVDHDASELFVDTKVLEVVTALLVRRLAYIYVRCTTMQ